MRRLWIKLRLPGWKPLRALELCRGMHTLDLRALQDPFWGHGRGAVWAARRALYERCALWGVVPMHYERRAW